MADAVPGNPATHHHPQADGGTRGGPQGAVPTAVYTLLRTHAEDSQATAAHMQRTVIAKTAEQLTYHTPKYLQHAATLPLTDQAHLLELLFYQP